MNDAWLAKHGDKLQDRLADAQTDRDACKATETYMMQEHQLTKTHMCTQPAPPGADRLSLALPTEAISSELEYTVIRVINALLSAS